MQGIIQTPHEWPHQYACFICPGCNEIHCLYVDLNKSQEIEGLHIWKYRFLSENTIELTPSYDNSKFCGWHGPYTWNIELVSIEQWLKITEGKEI